MFIVECYADELLITMLGVAKKDLRHEANKSEVLKALTNKKEQILNRMKSKQKKGYNRFVGIIDEDPETNQPNILKSFKEKESFGSIKVLENSSGEKVIIISPRLEDWLISRAEFNKLNLNKHKIPKTGKELHKTDSLKKIGILIDLLNNDKELIYLKRMIIK